MSFISKITIWTLLSCLLLQGVRAESISLKPFKADSYQSLLKSQEGRSFVLIIWSLTCPSCLKDMKLIQELHQKWPNIKLVLLTTDDVNESENVKGILSKYHLQGLENWIYADTNTQVLNFQIDPQWFGELPRTYFYDAKHQRKGVSGVISKQDFEVLFAKIQSAEGLNTQSK